MFDQSRGLKKGEQLKMSIVRSEKSPNILDGLKLESIDIRSDWKNILSIINSNTSIQKVMEESYQDFQEGFKIKDFRHPNVNGPWSFHNASQGIFPYMLTTNDWLDIYQNKEWSEQASNDENELKSIIDKAIDKCSILDPNSIIKDNLKAAKINLQKKYSPRPNQPEVWRPHNAAHWSSKWMKVLAEIHYKSLSRDWKIIENNSHSIVAGFGKENVVYLLDIILLTTDTNKIIKKFNE